MAPSSPRRGRKGRTPKPRALAGCRETELTIDALGSGGDGIATHEGRRLHVPFAAPGDRVRVRLPAPEAGEAAGGAADFVELVAAGPARAEPPCPHFGPCGGCRTQHVADAAYRDWKRDLVRRALARQGLTPPVAPAIVSPAHSRRRVTWTARHGGSGVFLGFNQHRSHRIVDLQLCVIAEPAIVALLAPLRRLLATILPPGAAADVAVTLLDDGLDVVIVAEAAPDLAAREALAAFAETEDLARLSWRLGTGAVEPVAHRRAGIVHFGDVPVTVPPGGFLQATRPGEAALTGLVLDAAVGARRIADLYCGAGTFTLPLATDPATDRRIRAFDGDAAAIAALAGAVRRSGLAGSVAVERRDLAREPLSPAELAGLDAVVFDPPRTGAAAQAAAIAASDVPLAIAVSCNPATLARDARLLVEGGFTLEAVTPVDQFLWSQHVEAVAIFRRPSR